MGTNAKIMVLISTEFSVSIGPTATARASAALCVPNKYAVSATRKKPIRLPVMSPALMASPPRTIGLPAARPNTLLPARPIGLSEEGIGVGSPVFSRNPGLRRRDSRASLPTLCGGRG
jgi:hypothetical protein